MVSTTMKGNSRSERFRRGSDRDAALQSHCLKCPPQPRYNFGIELSRIREADPVSHHGVPLPCCLESAARRRILQLDADVEAIAGWLDNTELAALTQQANVGRRRRDRESISEPATLFD